MANITVVQAQPSGTALTSTAPTAGPDNLPPGDVSGAAVYLLVDNASGGSTTITIADPGKTKYSVANASITGSVSAGTKKVFGPFYTDLQQSDGFIDVTSSVTASVTFYAWKG